MKPMNTPAYSLFNYALLQAAQQSDIEAVTDCLEHGAYLDVTDTVGRTPLMLACANRFKGTEAVVQLLLTCGANPAHRDMQDQTCAHVAAASGNCRVLDMLKSTGMHLDSFDLHHETPLHMSNDPQCTALLLGAGARIHAESKTGATPLHAAMRQGDVGNIELLLQYGANPNGLNKAGVNAIAMAWEQSRHDILHLFYRYSPVHAEPVSPDSDSRGFESWLANALQGTPHAFIPGGVEAPGHDPAATTLSLSSDEAYLPYFDMAELEQALKKPMDEERPRYLKQMREKGPLRVLKKIPERFDMTPLRENFPNFDKVTEFLEKQVALCRLSPKKVAAFMPVLLLGDPGVGKTRYLLEVSKLLGLEFGLVQCGGVSANFVISGSTTSWKNGKPGKIHTTLRDGQTINPIIMLDEIDKLQGSMDYDAHGPLYQLLEHKTAQAFQDECIDLPMDCSHIIWAATANNLHMIPDPIVSRLVVIDVPTPSGEALGRVTRSIYRDILEEHQDTWGGRFSSELGEDVISAVNSLTPRDIRKQLLSACGNAALTAGRRGNFEGSLALQLHDMDALPKSQRAARVGF